MPDSRRRAIARIAERFGVHIVEDDVYGPLLKQRLPPISSYLPELSFHCTSFTKSVMCGLRTGYLTVPRRMALRADSILRVNSWIATPLLAEVGVPGFDAIGSWWGIFAPKGINPGILEKVNKVINEAIVEPEFVTLFTNSSATAAPMKPAEFHKVLVDEVALTEKIIKDANIKIE